MNDSLHKLSDLVFKYLKGELTEAEARELNEFLEESAANRSFFEELTNNDKLNERLQEVYTLDDKVMWKNVVAATPRLQKGKIISIRSSLKYAAAVILIAGLGAYWLIGRHQKATISTVVPAIKPAQNDILPGGNKATLTLANGQTIILDGAANGNLAKEGKTEIVKTGDGQLAYDAPNTETDVYYNTVSTPKGGQYQLTLPDGSKVWMNASSSLYFPTAFVGQERLVELDGEAYFEVAPSTSLRTGAKMPFIVKLKSGMSVQVLGTHFNIMAYSEEKEIKTTLLEGSVKVSNGSAVAMLQPGQQALIPAGNTGVNIQVDNNADVNEAIAWKNGIFQFNNADLKTVMRQIARWYDVEVNYDDRVPEKRFTGRVARNLKASELLSGIEYVGVHFKIEGKKILVLP
jgi:transmembrane sensor